MPVLPERMWYNPANPTQRYWTILPNDPNIPAGYVDSQGRDGATPEALQVYRAGVNNQGAGAAPQVLPGYTDGDPTMRVIQPQNVNGILGGYGGGVQVQPKPWP